MQISEINMNTIRNTRIFTNSVYNKLLKLSGTDL